MDIKMQKNSGIINIGNGATYTVINHTKTENVDWERLTKEIAALKASSDRSIQKFADEAAEPIKKKDTGGIKNWLAKWVPCIGGLIETSYYILEIAARFGIL